MESTKSIYEMTWQEVAALRAGGCEAAIVPIGQVAQHGPHLPLATDAIQALAVCRRVVRHLQGEGMQMLLGPTIPFGHSPTHYGFPGTVELEPETLALVIHQVARSLVRQGFNKIVLFCCGGGNWSAVENAAYRLWHDDGAGVWVLGFFEVMDSAARMHLESHARGEHDGHAAELETSCVLAARPELVEMDLAVNHQSAAYRDLEALDLGAFNFNELSRATGVWDVRAFTDSGVWGNATLATQDKGEAILDSAARNIADHLAKYLYSTPHVDTGTK